MKPCKHTKAYFTDFFDSDGIREMYCPTCKSIVYLESDL